MLFQKIFCLIAILKLAQARYGFVPKFYGLDSAVIVDTDGNLTPTKNVPPSYRSNIRMPPPFPIWRYYPRYHIVPPPPLQMMAINNWAKTASEKTLTIPPAKPTFTTSTTTTTTTTTTPKPVITSTKSSFYAPLLESEFPREFLELAQKKLGLNSLEEIPSLEELGQLLGTESSEATLNYMKQLTSNEKGIALLKAYIESSDYTDNTGDSNNNTNNDLEDEDDREEEDDIREPQKPNDEGLIVVTDEDANEDYEQAEDGETITTNSKQSETPQTIQKFEELPQAVPDESNNQLQKNKEVNENPEYHQLTRITDNGNTISNIQESETEDNRNNLTETEITRDLWSKENSLKTPILIRESIPFNYPVPIRAQTTTSTETTLPPSPIYVPANSSVVHLNTPKILAPHVQQLSRVTKIPSKTIEDFLASKPKLLELATKISRFPISYDSKSPIESQILAAVQKAFEQDEDLQRLLVSSATLN